ncbi:hypothetical protein BH10CYA1_BH10CYA1_58860 [soil metagenome]
MQKRRNQQGSSVLEGVVGLWLVVAAIVLGTLLLVNAGVSTYCKEKLGFIANQAADYAAVLPPDGARQGLVQNMVRELVGKMGFSTAGTQVTIEDLTLVSRPGVKVTVTTPFSTFLSSVGGNIIPPLITLSDSAVALSNGWYPAYAVVVDLQGQKTLSILVDPAGQIPNDTLPVYGFNYFLTNVLKIRL